MTLPLFCGLHLIYGAVMAFTSERRMRGDGDVLGLPLLVTLIPVALISAPMGAIMGRFAAPWFFQGIAITEMAIEYERFHLGILIAIGAAAAFFTLLGNFAAIAFLSRDMRRQALAPIVIGLGMMSTTALVDPMGIIEVETGRMLFAHPAGLLSLAVPLCLAATYFFVRSRLSTAPAVSI